VTAREFLTGTLVLLAFLLYLMGAGWLSNRIAPLPPTPATPSTGTGEAPSAWRAQPDRADRSRPALGVNRPDPSRKGARGAADPSLGVPAPGGRLPAVLLRIRACESHGDYRADNPHSSASGAWQITDGTWDGFAGYSRALYAPPRVQDAKALALWLDRGTQPWAASRGCWS
jgi:hypothetical protein